MDQLDWSMNHSSDSDFEVVVDDEPASAQSASDGSSRANGESMEGGDMSDSTTAGQEGRAGMRR